MSEDKPQSLVTKESLDAPLVAEESPAPSRSSCPKLVVAWVTFLAMGAAIMQLNALNEYIAETQCHESYGGPCAGLSKHDRDSANSDAAMFSTVCMSIPNVFSLVTSVYLSVLSDFRGRRSIMLFCLGVSTLSSGVLLACIALKAPVWTCAPAAAIAGIGGSQGTLLGVLFAYIADVSTRAERTTSFSVIESVIFLSGAVGSTAGGELSTLHTTAPFICVVGMQVAALLVTLFGLVEGRKCSSEVAPSWYQTFQKSAKLALSRSTNSKNAVNCSPLFLVALFAVLYYCIIGVFSLIVPYLKSDQFGLADHEIGWMVSGQFLCKWGALVVLAPSVRRWVSNPEVVLIRLGGLIAAVMITGYALAPSVLAIVLVGMVESMDVVAIPALRSLLSLAVNEDEQGTALAMMANLETSVQLLAPFAMGQLYGRTNHRLPFLVLSGLGVCFCLMSLLIRSNPQDCSKLKDSFLYGGGSFVGGGSYNSSFIDVVPDDQDGDESDIESCCESKDLDLAPEGTISNQT